MPVIVVGADTPVGKKIVEQLLEPDREVRAFVSDLGEASRLKKLGVKVAIGDVSDASHVEGASTNCFSAVLVAAAASDTRERAFARDIPTVIGGWAEAVSDASVTRTIWVVTDEDPPPVRTREVATVVAEGDLTEVAAEVAALDDLAEL